MAKIFCNLNYRGRKHLPTSGHREGIIFQPYTNMMVIRSMPSHYQDANSEAQQPCRNQMKWVMRMHRFLKAAYQDCFEGEKSDYHQFRHYNLLSEMGDCVVSHGSLPALDIRVVDNHLEFDRIEKDWKPGDILRFISLAPDLQHMATFQDSLVRELKTETVVTEVLDSGYYSFIHLRPKSKGNLASTQRLVSVTLS